MRAILIEDNPTVRELVRGLLARHCPDVSVVGEAEDVAGGLALLLSTPAELWLLDVQLRDGTVFDILDQLPEEQLASAGLLFLTAFNDVGYVLQALRKSAVDYLLKPVDPVELTAAVDKVRQRRPGQDLNKGLKELLELVRSERAEQGPTRLPFYLSRGAVRVLDLDEVVYLEADDVVTHVHLQSGEHFTSLRNLGFYRKALEEGGAFTSISKSLLVNTRYIDRYEPAEHQVLLKSGKTLYTSRRGGRGLMAFFRGIWE
jgi:two-component system, LytTR family, response regulator